MTKKIVAVLSSNWVVTGLILLTLLVFARGVTPSFSADDYPHLIRNIDYQTALDAVSVFLELDGREYRPIVRFSLWLNHRMGSTAWPFHVTNLLLHLVNVLILYFFIYEVSRSKLHALVGSALFALHPIHSTNINFVMGRTGILCATFFLSSVFLFTRSLDKKRLSGSYLISVTFFIFALLSKEMAVSLPAILFLTFFLRDFGAVPRNLFSMVKRIFPFIVIDCLYLMARIGFWMKNAQAVSVYTNYSPAHLIENLLQWAFGLFFPFELYRLKDLLISYPLGFAAVTSAFVLALLVMFTTFFWKNKKEKVNQRFLACALFWYIITLIPIAGGNAHRWYLYIPSVSVPFLVLAVLPHFHDRRRCLIFSGIICIALGAFAVESARQTEIWSEQSRISQSFLQQVKVKDLHEIETFYFANVPFGYKSAFLFTFNSLADAISLNAGHAPDLRILSYVNLRDSLGMSSTVKPGQVSFSLVPDHYGFFIFPPAKRHFAAGGKKIQSHGLEISIGPINAARKVTRYEISIPEGLDDPVFYFDGEKIRRY